ncbi:MAG TPA: hypothetical protein DC042_05025 [Bacteroidales bacterium]|nr:hypothetical protein [Bacteroidales bacterium]
MSRFHVVGPAGSRHTETRIESGPMIPVITGNINRTLISTCDMPRYSAILERGFKLKDHGRVLAAVDPGKHDRVVDRYIVDGIFKVIIMCTKQAQVPVFFGGRLKRRLSHDNCFQAVIRPPMPVESGIVGILKVNISRHGPAFRISRVFPVKGFVEENKWVTGGL